MTHNTPPEGLAERGAAFWESTIDGYELSESELRLLEEACRTLDALDALDAAIREHGPMVTGSHGQPVVNGALTEARGQRALLHRLLSALALPDPDGATVTTAQSSRAKRAASVRWKGHESEASMKARGY